MKKISINDNEYPETLKEISSPPEVLYVEGDYNLLNYKNSLTVIGSRNMSEYGRINTERIVKDLVKNNVCIVSGLAIGIDAVAHWTCIDNNGKTIAVLGSGLNKIFPEENTDLFKKILKKGGCIISEHSPNTIAQKSFFPRRNRIVSGLSLGTLVVEATYRSGTSITAKFAFNQNKKVYCIPNSVGNKNSAGTINLLKNGAKIITRADEILEDLGILGAKNVSNEEMIVKEKLKFEIEQLNTVDDITKTVYRFIKSNGVINSELISNGLKINMQDLNMHLSILELKELIVDNGMMNFSISKKVSY